MLESLKKLIPARIFRALRPLYHFIFAWLAAFFYRFPSREIIVVGVTGTAGKTSVVSLASQMLSSAGYKTGYTSTAVFSDGDETWLNDQKMTMPGRFFIQRNLRRMIENGCRYAIIETTSEGVKQFRHRFINYDILIFTSLYPEHIESHGSFEKYKEAKGKLFAHLKDCTTKYCDESGRVMHKASGLRKTDLSRVHKTIIVNGDDEHAKYFLNFWSENKYIYTLDEAKQDLTVGLTQEARNAELFMIRGEDAEAGTDGVSLKVGGENIRLKLLGAHNAYNALAVFALGISRNLPSSVIKEGLESVSSLPGKLELIDEGQDFTAIVDYSFEPQALAKLYEAIAPLPRARLIHLLGSTGGGRDQSRRPILGKMAGEQADIVIVTNEDPYDEDPQLIIDQVASGSELAGKKLGENLFKVLDRREGIRKALTLANEGDIVLFTGKGAEQFICLAGGKKMPWDERRIVAAEIRAIKGFDK